MSNLKVVRRHRGDGRAIVVEVPGPMPRKMYGGALIENLVQSQAMQSIPRYVTKMHRFGTMYSIGPQGFKAVSTSPYPPRSMYSTQRDPSNGPFKVYTYQGRRQTVGSGSNKQRAYKVTNKHGARVHRGSRKSCIDVCDNLNVEYAKWLMVKPDTSEPELWEAPPARLFRLRK